MNAADRMLLEVCRRSCHCYGCYSCILAKDSLCDAITQYLEDVGAFDEEDEDESNK